MIDLSALPQGREAGVALLVRHAERPEIPSGRFGYKLPITDAGRHRALALGKRLGTRLGRVVTSAVPRCMQTAAAILAGSGVERTITTDARLGDPGAWIADVATAGDVFRDLGAEEVVRRQLTERVAGMHSMAVGAESLLSCLLEPGPALGDIDVFVSHDAVMAPLLSHAIGSVDLEAIWPRFLEGACLVRSPGGVELSWRDEVVSLNP